MNDRRDIDLEGSAYRQIPQKPLGPVKGLWLGVIFCLGMAVLTSSLAADWGGFWPALMPIPFALGAGIGLAGLFPGYFFGQGN